MTTRSIPTIDPGNVAAKRGAEGQGIVVAILGTGVDGKHPHFARHANLVLPPPLQHYDLTLLPEDDENPSLRGWRPEDFSDEVMQSYLEKIHASVDLDLLGDEALIAETDHSTHVAAIVAGEVSKDDPDVHWLLGADESPMRGVAPKSKVLVLKAIADDGSGDDRGIVKALDVVLGLNARAGKLAVPIVLIPFSIPHDVRNYACGRTPVCEAAERLVASGVVVVCPAGNKGYVRIPTANGEMEMVALAGITDPGNAERVITVGATHRWRPQEYGASYFSSRGPTLDGRLKPDLLAPGERILSAVVSSRSEERQSATYATYGDLDGTSMAAAHVAGAVAVLLSARPELIGKPDEVKKLLLSTATDLGRPPQFQGRGLLNLSRALGEVVDVEAQPAAEKPESRTSAASSQGERQAPSRFDPGPKRFALAVSFVGEKRDYVKQVIHEFRNLTRLPQQHIFYDHYHNAILSRPNLDKYLQTIYREQSELVVVFLSKGYDTKQWTGGVEWSVIREVMVTPRDATIMPVRLDDTPIEGLAKETGYLTAFDPDDPDYVPDADWLAEEILKRLKWNRSEGLS